MTDVAPNTWADSGYKHTPKERKAKAARFGIPEDAVPALVQGFTEAVSQHHITTAFPDLRIARDFYLQCSDKDLVALVGIGLHASLLESLLAQRSLDVNAGYGLLERLGAGTPLEKGGHPLGHEPLGYEACNFHSWLCNDGPADVSDHLGIRPNHEGFISTLQEARQATQYLRNSGATQAMWEPWLVVRYTTGP